MGFAGARIDTIATEAGYNKSLIFHYFGDTEGLYRAIIVRLKKRMMDGYLEPLTAFVQSSDEMSVSRLRMFLELNIDRYLAFLSKNPRNLHIMAWEVVLQEMAQEKTVDVMVAPHRSYTATPKR